MFFCFSLSSYTTFTPHNIFKNICNICNNIFVTCVHCCWQWFENWMNAMSICMWLIISSIFWNIANISQKYYHQFIIFFPSTPSLWHWCDQWTILKPYSFCCIVSIDTPLSLLNGIEGLKLHQFVLGKRKPNSIDKMG